jgi:uncharacterized membrane protein YeiH
MIQILDYIGTFAFGLSGGMVAVEKKMDVVGILILSTITGIGGGILRDLILGNVPPTAFQDSAYFPIVLGSGILVFFFYRKIKALEKVVVLGDALGLGVFTIVGIEKGLLFGMPPFNCILMGLLTATFGGVIRDVLANRIPFILKREIYLSLCFFGGILFFFLRPVLPEWLNSGIVILFISVLRSVAYLKKWNLPRARL